MGIAMKKMSIVPVALVVSATSSLIGVGAYAADLPQQPAYKSPPVYVAPVSNWTGCYIGGNIGADWGRADATIVNTGSGVSWTNTGFIGGGQVGCDYQFGGAFVVGARAMFDGTSLNSGTTFSGGLANGYTADSDTSWVITLTGRLGYAVMPDALLYFQGGGAWTRQNAYIKNPAGSQVGQFAGNRSGWTIGGGLEYKFAPNWSAFLEYNYMDFGTASGSAVVNGVSYTADLQRDAQSVLVGVNYRF